MFPEPAVRPWGASTTHCNKEAPTKFDWVNDTVPRCPKKVQSATTNMNNFLQCESYNKTMISSGRFSCRMLQGNHKTGIKPGGREHGGSAPHLPSMNTDCFFPNNVPTQKNSYDRLQARA